MRIRPFVFPALAAALVLSGPVLGYAVAARPAKAPHNAHHVYRLDYLVTVREPDKAPVTSPYTMNVEDGSTGSVHAGANIPLVTGSSSAGTASPRQDVGLLLRCHLTQVGSDLVLHNDAEISGTEERADPGPRAIRKITANDDAVASPGKPTLVASLEEPVSHARYEVTVTATKLR
jgi:hypothetical protein